MGKETKHHPSGVRFEQGTKECGWCKTKEKVIQFERETKRKGLPIVEIAFICESCARKENLIEESSVVVFDEELTEDPEDGPTWIVP